MKTLKMLMLASVIFFVAGCKIAVIVVEGGEVQSGASGTCGAGTVCIDQVNGTNYTETFTAVADPGWKFVRWNKGDDSLCGDRTEPSCHITTTIFEGNTAVEAVIASAQTFYVMPIFKESTPITDTVAVERKIWAQVKLFNDLSWEDINAVCPSGPCSDNGILNGWDMAGWVWASIEDMNSLFNYYIGFEELGPGPSTASFPYGTITTAFFGDGWMPTYDEGINGTTALSGYTKEGSPQKWSLIIRVVGGAAAADVAFTGGVTPVVQGVDFAPGGWFHRAP